jgi:hypothetical protein
MPGARGDHSVLFTAPAGERFADLAGLRSDFTNPVVTGKMRVTKISALHLIKLP